MATSLLQNIITSPVNATSWPACEKLARVRPKFVLTRVLVLVRVNKVGSNPGLFVPCKQGL